MPQTSIEKIITKYAVGQSTPAHAGDFVTIRPKHIMTHDNTGAVIPKFESIVGKGGKVHNPKQPMIGIDHDIQNVTPENLGKYAKIAKFAADQGIDYYPPGRGIAHQIMVEEGYATPGTLVVGSDSHSNLYGAVAAVGTPVVRTDAAAIWATGETWWQIPPQIKVVLTGSLSRDSGATGKDVIIALCGHFKDDEVLNAAIEFVGPGVAQLTVDERMTISNMTTEWGALVGMFPFDEVLKDYLLGRAKDFESRAGKTPRYTAADVNAWWADRASFASDAEAHYAKSLTLDLSTVSPHISGPNSVKVMNSVAAVEPKKMKIDKAYLMSCVNARLSDLADAAKVFTDAGPNVKIAAGLNFYVAAASSTIEAQAKDAGYWGTLVNAGATTFPSGCGACIGLGAGTLEAGEVGISATNRNFQGRMGSRDALCYLASPAVVAQSAINGYISAPQSQGASQEIVGTCTVTPVASKVAPAQEILEGFPGSVTGRALFLPTDNLNTDGIYGKDVTYRDDITFEQQGQHAMLNYDPEFQAIAQAGDIIVGARNFGTGSSREQAATALASKGIKLVIAATAGQTYKRNAFNNGFIVLECPALVDQLQETLKPTADQLTVPGPEITVDFQASTITCNAQSHRFGALSTTAQRLVVAGGSEAVVREQLAKK